jgi:hypothetical protein
MAEELLFLDLFYPDDGGSKLLRNIGNEESTWHHIPESANVRKREFPSWSDPDVGCAFA